MNYEISEKRLEYLISKIIRNLDLYGLYRVQINLPIGKSGYVVGLFMDKVMSIKKQENIKNELEDALKSILNFDGMVIIIPYSEAKYHLRKPKNI
jgi:divalent metal cation (Fe/Co/Zn/Cd) transporter